MIIFDIKIASSFLCVLISSKEATGKHVETHDAALQREVLGHSHALVNYKEKIMILTRHFRWSLLALHLYAADAFLILPTGHGVHEFSQTWEIQSQVLCFTLLKFSVIGFHHFTPCCLWRKKRMRARSVKNIQFISPVMVICVSLSPWPKLQDHLEKLFEEEIKG